MTHLNLTLALSDLQILRDAKNEIVLGIILADGTVRLRLSDPHRVPGHRDWLEQEPMVDQVRAFSVGVLDGRVHVIHTGSRYNQNASRLLEPELVKRLRKLIPLASRVKVLGY